MRKTVFFGGDFFVLQSFYTQSQTPPNKSKREDATKATTTKTTSESRKKRPKMGERQIWSDDYVAIVIIKSLDFGFRKKLKNKSFNDCSPYFTLPFPFNCKSFCAGSNLEHTHNHHFSRFNCVICLFVFPFFFLLRSSVGEVARVFYAFV